jgi:hypothetical protein
MANVSVQMGGGGTCPQCRRADASQRVTIVLNAIAGRISPAEFEALSLSQSLGEITQWNSPRGTTLDNVTPKIALPAMPPKPWVLRFVGISQRARWYACIGLMLVGFCVGRLLPDQGLMALLLGIVFPILVLGGLTMYGLRKEPEYQAALIEWGKKKSKWMGLRYCARCNTLFEPGCSKIIQVTELDSYLKQVDR